MSAPEDDGSTAGDPSAQAWSDGDHVEQRPPRIVIIYAHSGLPPSHVNSKMLAAASELPHVRVHDLYQRYPDFFIDIAHEQRALEEADLVVFQHPVQWYGMPSLMKEWIDAVLQHGWAYGEGGNALRGKRWWSVMTAGGTHENYGEQGIHGFPFAAFMPPFIQTARLCGMQWLPPMVLNGAHDIDAAGLYAHIEKYRQRLLQYPDWTADISAENSDIDATGV